MFYPSSLGAFAGLKATKTLQKNKTNLLQDVMWPRQKTEPTEHIATLEEQGQEPNFSLVWLLFSN